MSTSASEPHACDTAALNVLLRGEMSAVETYTHAMGQLDDPALIADLQKIRDEHSRAVRELRDHVVAFGGVPAHSAGVWSTFAAAVGTTTQTLERTAVLAALSQGEQHGISTYEDALNNEMIHPECHRNIRSDLLPACRKHVEELSDIVGGSQG